MKLRQNESFIPSWAESRNHCARMLYTLNSVPKVSTKYIKVFVNCLNGSALRVGRHEDKDSSMPWGMAADPPNLREFKLKHKALKKNWELPDSFPSAAVVQVCYLPLHWRSVV